MHFAPTYNTHAITSLSKDHTREGFGSTLVTSVFGTDYLVCMDATHSTLYLLQRRGMGMEDIPDKPYKDIPEDLVISKCQISMLPLVRGATCCGICSDESGSTIYLLMLAPPYGYIKHIQLRNKVLTEIPITYSLPTFTLPVYPEHYDDTFATGYVDVVNIDNQLGEICFINKYVSGAGLAYAKGRLFILTRRKVPVTVPLPPPHTLTGERKGDVFFSTLLQVNAITGQCNHACRLSVPGVGGVNNPEDAIFHGLAYYRDKIYTVKRPDKFTLPHCSELWGLSANEQERGEGAVVSLALAHLQEEVFPAVPYVGNKVAVEFRDYPFELVMPYSLSIDEGDRKLYATLGDRTWTFDMLCYTLMVLHGDSLFAGDIIDFGSVKDSNVRVLQCFLRNDDIGPMYDITANIYLKVNEPRREDVFLAHNATEDGKKTLNLGTLLPGESVSFETRIYPLGVTAEDEYTTIRLPLRIKYNLSE